MLSVNEPVGSWPDVCTGCGLGAGILWNETPGKVGGTILKAGIPARTEWFALPLRVVLHMVYPQCCSNEEVVENPP